MSIVFIIAGILLLIAAIRIGFGCAGIVLAIFLIFLMTIYNAVA